MYNKRYPLGYWTKTGIMVSYDPHYPLKITTNSEIRRVFILDRFEPVFDLDAFDLWGGAGGGLSKSNERYIPWLKCSLKRPTK